MHITDLAHGITSIKIRYDKTRHKQEGISHWCRLVYYHLLSSGKTMSTCNYHLHPITSALYTNIYIALSFTNTYRNMGQIAHTKKGVRYQQLNCQTPRPDSCCKQIKRIYGQVWDAAIGLLVRTSMSQIRGIRLLGFCFLLKAGEFCVRRHSNWPEPAFAKRRHFHHTHTDTKSPSSIHTPHTYLQYPNTQKRYTML